MYSMVLPGRSEDIPIVYSSTMEQAARGTPMMAHSKRKHCPAETTPEKAAEIDGEIACPEGEAKP
jgi:hypothetical protein